MPANDTALSPAEAKIALKAWRQRGYADAQAGRIARTPLRDDDGAALAAYNDGYRCGNRARAEA